MEGRKENSWVLFLQVRIELNCGQKMEEHERKTQNLRFFVPPVLFKCLPCGFNFQSLFFFEFFGTLK
jgi:hypothetical protein